MAMDVGQVLRVVCAALEHEHARFALAGAFALNAHGLGRATADLDLVVPRRVQDRLIAELERRGFETLHRSEGFSNHLHPSAELGRLDIIYVDEATAELLFAGARHAGLGEREVLVPKPEHLIAMKVQAIKNDRSRRLRDLADVQYLLSLPGVDRGEARGYFEKAGLLKEWDELER